MKQRSRDRSRVSVDLPRAVHKALKTKCTQEDLTVKAVVTQLIELWVKGEISLPQPESDATLGKGP